MSSHDAERDVTSRRLQPLAGLLVVDLTRYLPGPYASRELLRLGARVVRFEPPGGDPVRDVAPEWDASLNGGKESVVCDLKAEPELGRALCARADVVVESFRPGVAARLGVGPDDVPASAVYCSITGFGARLTGELACYRIYRTADGRWLTVAALERPFFARLCELLGRPQLVERQYDPGAQEALAAELEEAFAARPLAAWLELFEGQGVAAGPGPPPGGGGA